MLLGFCRAINLHEAMPPIFRVKPDKQTVESLCEHAAALWHIGQELMAEHPISKQVVQDRLYDAWAMNSNDRLVSDLASALMEKRDDFKLTDVMEVSTILAEHHGNIPVQDLNHDSRKYVMCSTYVIMCVHMYISRCM